MLDLTTLNQKDNGERKDITKYLCNEYHNDIDIKSPIKPSYLQGFNLQVQPTVNCRKKKKVPKT